MKTRFYAVVKGRQTGIFNRWDDGARPQVEGFPGAIFKSFTSTELAEIWWAKNHTSNPIFHFERQESPKPPSKEGQFFTYLIVDPRNGVPFYVGQTSCMRTRQRKHLDMSRNANREYKKLIAEIFASGFSPEFRVVDHQSTEAESLRSETEWVKRLASKGVRVMNRWKEHQEWIEALIPKFLIEPADLPEANLQLITPIPPRRGWLKLAQKAVEIAAGEPIASIKEKSGLLDVHIFTREAAKFPHLHELRQASASICEICGEPGTLAYHQVRCEDHQGWRTSSPFPPDQRGYIEACEWENAPAMGLEYGSMVIDLQTRELTRRNALWALGNSEKRDQATQDLLRVWRADRDFPIGPAAGLSVDEIRNQVHIHVEEGVGSLVRYSEIPEPWAIRFQMASYGATRALDGYYARDWDRFLDLWPAEAEQIEALVERELERQVIAGIQKAAARSVATLADLGIDSVELGEWVAEQVGEGRWPEGDFAEAFRVWRDQKNTSNAVPDAED